MRSRARSLESRERELPPHVIHQPETTHSGAKITPPQLDLPKRTTSICPECRRLIPALIREEDGKVVMEKTCPEHGEFKDVVYSDVEFYLKAKEWFFGDGRGFSNPQVPDPKDECPLNCGICSRHTSNTALANIDLTNRCNLKCPICFANAAVTGYLYEPSYEQVVEMLKVLRERKPVPVACVQFSGGEPTIHPDFIRIIRTAREMGFAAIQVATNGLKFADLEFAQEAKEAGLHSLYLQFDGLDDEIYIKTRGRRLLETKLKAIENARKVGMKVVLVPTVVRTVNDHQLGDMVKFAIKNVDVISGISFQPVSFTGRIKREERERFRFTISDLAIKVEEQTGFIKADGWVPICAEVPLSRLFAAIEGHEVTTYSCHPHCGAATYLFVDDEGNAVQITDFLDLKGLLREMDQLADKLSRSRFNIKLLSGLRALNVLRKYFIKEKAPKGLTFKRFLATIDELRSNKYERDPNQVGKNSYRSLMVGGMHFMDAYNYDVERVRRCVIHYVAPNGRMYPFCAYNSGPVFRERIERRFSVPYKGEER